MRMPFQAFVALEGPLPTYFYDAARGLSAKPAPCFKSATISGRTRMTETAPLWTPKPQDIEAAPITAFARQASAVAGR